MQLVHYVPSRIHSIMFKMYSKMTSIILGTSTLMNTRVYTVQQELYICFHLGKHPPHPLHFQRVSVESEYAF